MPILHHTLPDLLSLTAILDASCYVRNAVFDSVGQALQTVTDGFGAGGVVDGLADAATGSAYEATSSARDAADGCAELGGGVRWR